MGCCHSNTKCYMQTDCASYIANCGFTNDGKKGESLGSCLPDSTAFTPAKCAADTKNQEGIPVLNPTVKCWQSERLLCNVYRNKTATYFTAQCKPSNKTSSSAAHTQAARLPLLVRIGSSDFCLGQPQQKHCHYAGLFLQGRCLLQVMMLLHYTDTSCSTAAEQLDICSSKS